MFSFIGGGRTIRTHGHREGSVTHWGLMGGLGEEQWWVGSWGGITWGECQIYMMGMEAVNHIAIYVPMQQSCMFCTCTREPKVQ